MMEIFLAIMGALSGLALFIVGVWNLDNNRGFPILFLSLIPLIYSIMAFEHLHREDFRQECLDKNGVIAYTENDKQICIPKGIKYE